MPLSTCTKYISKYTFIIINDFGNITKEALRNVWSSITKNLTFVTNMREITNLQIKS